MKKGIYALIIVFFIVLGGGFFVINNPSKTPTQVGSNVVLPTTTFIFNGTTYADVQASNPYEALIFIAKENAIELQTKHYDFGVFVEGIGEQKNTTEKAWIYYVNGASGEVAADKYELKQGDLVEWKYITPIY
jgi:hypothetical protein